MSNLKEFEKDGKYLRQIWIKAYVTNDYSIFKWDPSNRPTNEKHINEIADSIKKRGNLSHLYLVLTSPDATVIDGQYRVKASEKTQTDVTFIPTDEISPIDSAEMSLLNQEWKISEVIHHYAERGFPEYVKLRHFWTEHPRFSATKVARLCCTSGMNNHEFSNLFNAGLYQANNIEHAHRVYMMAVDYGEWIPFSFDFKFLALLHSLAENKNYNHHHMMKKMKVRGSSLTKSTDIRQYYNLISKIYNFKVKEDDWVELRPKNMR